MKMMSASSSIPKFEATPKPEYKTPVLVELPKVSRTNNRYEVLPTHELKRTHPSADAGYIYQPKSKPKWPVSLCFPAR